MEKILNKTALQNLLKKHWTSFIDKTRLIALVLQQVRDTDLPKISGDRSNRKQGITVTLSNVECVHNGLLLWIDFTVPAKDDNTCTGTCEVIVSYDGVAEPQQTVGCMTEY